LFFFTNNIVAGVAEKAIAYHRSVQDVAAPCAEDVGEFGPLKPTTGPGRAGPGWACLTRCSGSR